MKRTQVLRLAVKALTILGAVYVGLSSYYSWADPYQDSCSNEAKANAGTLGEAFYSELRAWGIEDPQIVAVLGSRQLGTVQIAYVYSLNGQPKRNSADSHFEYEKQRWVFIPEDRWVRMGIFCILRRPQIVLRWYYRYFFVPDGVALEQRRCARSPDHVFWVRDFPFCILDGAPLNTLIQKQAMKGRTIKGEWIYHGNQRERRLKPGS